MPSPDGTPIAVFGTWGGRGRPLLLVHGASADHTTFRVVGPLLARHATVEAMDRRGRGASGDTAPYAITREFEDVAAVAELLADEHGGPIDVFGHSYGGRCALGAAIRTDAIRRVVSYEGAPAPSGQRYGDPQVVADLQRLADADDRPALLATFLRRVVGMSEEDLARYRADPVWPVRVAAAPTIVRELEAESNAAGAASLTSLAEVRQPVLQLLGGDSHESFGAATHALDERLGDGRVVVIPGARHAAHHSHPEAVVTAIAAFLESD